MEIKKKFHWIFEAQFVRKGEETFEGVRTQLLSAAWRLVGISHAEK